MQVTINLHYVDLRTKKNWALGVGKSWEELGRAGNWGTRLSLLRFSFLHLAKLHGSSSRLVDCALWLNLVLLKKIKLTTFCCCHIDRKKGTPSDGKSWKEMECE